MRRYWTRMLKGGPITDEHRKDARKLRRILDEIERSRAAHEVSIPDPFLGLPSHTVWAARPKPWCSLIEALGPNSLPAATKIAEDTTLYHDGDLSDVHVRQSIGSKANPFDLSFDVAEFDGTYVSVAIALPKSQIAAVQRSDLLRLDLSYSSTRPIKILGRANVKIGPNIEAIPREVDLTRAKPVIEFDLFYLEMEAEKISDVWVDIILEKPSMSVVTIHDLRLSRRPRAQT